jgi:hypothetical protein
VFGFGGVPGPGQPVSHCFALAPEVEVAGVEGILIAYANALPIIRLSGPTLFAPILSAAVGKAQQSWQAVQAGGPLQYIVMLILTDGEWRAHLFGRP